MRPSASAFRSASASPRLEWPTIPKSVSAIELHPHSGFAEELDCDANGVWRAFDLRASQGGSLEGGVVEEPVDASGPRRGVDVRLVVVTVAGRCSVGRTALAVAVSQV